MKSISDELDEILTIYSSSIVGLAFARADDLYKFRDNAKQAILNLIERERVEARIDESTNALKLDLYSLADTQELEEVIGRCEGKHVQQVVYSTYHKGMTRVCFGCMQVDTTIDLNKIKQKPPTKFSEQLINGIADVVGETIDELNEPAPHKEWLKPSEIAERNLIVNSKGKGDYRYVLRLIKSGKLPARNWAEQGEKPYWLVSYFEIIKYNEMLRQGVIV